MNTQTHLDAFTRAYLIAALWSSSGDAGNPLDSQYTVDDFAPEAIEQAVKDCAAFQEQAGPMIAGGRTRSNEYTHDEMAGHDFWLTRCGHGAGFWDGDWPEHGEKLTELCEGFGNLDPYVGDDGKIYFA